MPAAAFRGALLTDYEGIACGTWDDAADGHHRDRTEPVSWAWSLRRLLGSDPWRASAFRFRRHVRGCLGLLQRGVLEGLDLARSCCLARHAYLDTS